MLYKSKKWLFVSALLLSCLFAFFHESSAGQWLETVVARKLEFYARTVFHKNPPLSPKLKMYFLDDATVQAMQSTQVSDLDWARIFYALSLRKPEKIIVDLFFGQNLREKEELLHLQNVLAHSQTPVYVASYVSVQKIPYAHEISREYLKKTLRIFSYSNHGGADYGGYTYGPAPSLLPYFKGVGHVMFASHQNIPAFLNLEKGESKILLPALGLHAASSFVVHNEDFFVNGHKLRLDSRGNIMVNFLPRKDLYQHASSLLPLLNAARMQVPIEDVHPGDIVLILPMMYTGNADFKSSPVGDLEGGLFHACIINSVLTGKWLGYVPFAPFWVAAFSLSGALLAYILSLRAILWLLPFSTLSIIILGFYTFIFHDTFFPWFFSSLGFLLSCLVVFFYKARLLEQRNAVIASALEGLVAPHVLKRLYANPEALKFDAVEAQVTLMFLDIANFSILAEKKTPQEIFFELKETLSMVVQIIHAHNGIVDKTLGDGLLAFFGYDYDGKQTSGVNHARAALACAIEIQRQLVKKQLELVGKSPSRNFYAVRIGINSGSVFIGNLGSEKRIDFTLVGNTVNFAKRLEEACEPFRIILGDKTRDLCNDLSDFQSALFKRFVTIKHHEELIEAWEFHPFLAEYAQLLQQAMIILRPLHTRIRVAERWPLPRAFVLPLVCEAGIEGTVCDISLSGLSFESKDYIAVKVQLVFSLGDKDSEVYRVLKDADILPILGEVRWGIQQGQLFRHGVKFLNLHPQKAEMLLKILKDYASKVLSSA